MNERLAQQIAFLVEADKLKAVIRRTPLVDTSRLENSAEHCWHLVLVVMVMREYAAPGVDWLCALSRWWPFTISWRSMRAMCRRTTRTAWSPGPIANGPRPTGFSACFPTTNACGSASCGKSSRRTKHRRRASQTPPIVSSLSCRTRIPGGGSWCNQSLEGGQIVRRMAPIESALPDVWPHVLDVIESFCVAGVLRRE